MSDKPYEGMTCQDCERPFSEVIDFLVATPIWNYVMAGQGRTTYSIGLDNVYVKGVWPHVEGVPGVVCLACFDVRARAAGISYRDSVTVLGTDCWMGYESFRTPLIPSESECDWSVTG